MSLPRARRRGGAAAQHTAWMRLLDVTGPFLSVPVLLEAFPQGLDADDPELAARLARAFSEWEGGHDDPAVHRAFVRFVLAEVLEYPDDLLREGPSIPQALTVDLREHGTSLRPDLAVLDADDAPALVVVVRPPGEPMERRVTTAGLTASPAERVQMLLRGTRAQTALVTNGEAWMLVHQPPDGPATFATWHTPLLTEERETLRAFRSLLGARRVVGQTPSDSLAGLLARSADDEREVTDALGDQARRAVELLVAAFDSADRDSGGALLDGVEPPTLYEAVVAATMRIIFLLAAEGQGLLPEEETWTASYAVAPMRAQLREDAGRYGEEVLERRMDAWMRLCATFRAVHGGVTHDRLRLPGYGGGLFDPARFPFLEGGDRAAQISNRVVLRVLDNLQTLQVTVPGGGQESRPLSFAALGVEQIGHVYERLLEHTAVRTDGPALGLTGTRGKEPEVALDHLEELTEQGDDRLFAFLREQTGRTLPALQRDFGRLADEQRLRVACEGDEDLLDRVLPLAGLVRDDPYGRPCVFLPGRVYVTQRPGGRAFQSHYTPPALTEPIVRHALEPVVYEGPAEGWEPGGWRLKDPDELLALRVCDIAMGSAAFLVAACRFLATCLVRSWQQHPNCVPDALPADADEQHLLARRLVAERCIYGVDKNPLAVDIAKVSMWLVTLRRDRPFTFLDHALRCGDSLVGIADVRQLERLSLDPGAPASLLSDAARRRIEETLVEVRTLREVVASSDAHDLRDVTEKTRLTGDAQTRTQGLRAVADLVVGAALSCAGTRTDPRVIVEDHAPAIEAALAGGPDAPVASAASDLLLTGRASGDARGPRPLHWPLEFPEVFFGKQPGFDVVVGNPPFLKGREISGVLGTRYRAFVIMALADGRRGIADLSAYFLLRAYDLLTSGGCMALLATNTIAQGDTREVSLEQLEARGASIYRAVPSRPWPGEASLEIAAIWQRRGAWRGHTVLADIEVPAITAYLSAPGRVRGAPLRLVDNTNRAFIGSFILGQGFVLTPDEAQGVMARDPETREVLFPYLNGEDLQSRPDQSASRWVINFSDWSEERSAAYREPFAIVEERVRPGRSMLRSDDASAKTYARLWWQFGRRAVRLYDGLRRAPLAVARAVTSSHHALVEVPRDVVFSHAVVIFILQSWRQLAPLQSSLHEAWIWRHASSLGNTPRYTPSDCFETFPFPNPLPGGETGKRLHDLRGERTRARSEGLTRLMNRVNDPGQEDEDLVALRELMGALDGEVVDAYGWSDLDLDHGFHGTRFGIRFTIGPEARAEVLDRLLELNHARYADEVGRGLHERRGGRGGGRRRAAPAADAAQAGLFPH